MQASQTKRRRAIAGLLLSSATLSLFVLPPSVSGQAGLSEVVIQGPAGLCLDVLGSWSSAHPPPPGTLVVLSPCDGSEDQRFSLCFGDCQDDVRAVGSSTISAVGGRLVIGSARAIDAELQGGSLRVWIGAAESNTPGVLGASCATSVMPPVRGAPLTVGPCDGRPGQAFGRAP